MLNDLITSGWAEIEHIQQQLAFAKEKDQNIATLLNNLLTSYYIYVGGLENLAENKLPINDSQSQKIEPTAVESRLSKPAIQGTIDDTRQENSQTAFEPFEYFVDFDMPIGQPITDADLYG